MDLRNTSPSNPEWYLDEFLNVLSYDDLKFSDVDSRYTIFNGIEKAIDASRYLKKDTLYLAIDPGKDLNIQFEKAKKLFNSDPNVIEQQKALKIEKRLVERQTREKWLRYLRFLDARDSGASWREIATLLDGEKADPAQSARNTWNLAARVRREFCCTI